MNQLVMHIRKQNKKEHRISGIYRPHKKLFPTSMGYIGILYIRSRRIRTMMPLLFILLWKSASRIESDHSNGNGL